MNKPEARKMAREVYPQCPVWLCDICAGKKGKCPMLLDNPPTPVGAARLL